MHSSDSGLDAHHVDDSAAAPATGSQGEAGPRGISCVRIFANLRHPRLDVTAIL